MRRLRSARNPATLRRRSDSTADQPAMMKNSGIAVTRNASAAMPAAGDSSGAFRW